MDFLPGISAATTGMIIGYPFDAIKIKMQTNMYPNSLSCIKNVAQGMNTVTLTFPNIYQR